MLLKISQTLLFIWSSPFAYKLIESSCKQWCSWRMLRDGFLPIHFISSIPLLFFFSRGMRRDAIVSISLLILQFKKNVKKRKIRNLQNSKIYIISGPKLCWFERVYCIPFAADGGPKIVRAMILMNGLFASTSQCTT